MFSVIISEKGGAERRESFDRTEINVGRVQGNDLMLPKGNVSKRHARLLYRDGRFIVTDLKSTNGTYVNGRKIAQATIVREGDKIYIGDFVLRIETAAMSAGAAAQPAPSQPQPEEAPAPAPAPAHEPLPASAQQAATSANLQVAAFVGAPQPQPVDGGAAYQPQRLPAVAPAPPAASAPPQPGPSQPGPSQPSTMTPPESPSSSQRSSSAEKGLRPPVARIEPKTGDRHEVISHFPLEHDPDESVHYAVPGPPRVPSSPRPAPGPSNKPTAPAVPAARHAVGTQLSPAAPPVMVPPVALPQPALPQPGLVMPPPPIPAPIERPTSPSTSYLGGAAPPGVPVSGAGAPSPLRRPAPQPIPEPAFVPVQTPPPAPTAERPHMDPGQAAAHRAALLALSERVTELVDLRPIAGGAIPDEAMVARIDRALAEAAAPMRGQPGVDADALIVEARRELVEYGPLTPLFDDEDLTEVQVVRHDYVVAIYGRRQVPADVGFTSEQAVDRVVRRLAAIAGRPLGDGESFVERRLPRGARMFAVLPSASDHGHMIVIRKPQRADLTLEDLVRSGTISRAMASLFAHCIAARANILVTGSVGAGATSLIGALAAAGSTDDRVVVLQEDDELIFNQPHTISILLGETPEEGARAVQAAARVRPDRLVVGAFAGPVAAEVVDAMGDGVDGVLAAARAPTLRQAVARLTADLAATKAGITPEVAREWLASAFDLVIEIARLRDGRHRVLRVAELGIDGARVAIRDIFAFSIERTAAGGAIEGSFYPTGAVPGIIEDLAARGITVDPSIFKRHASARADAPPTPSR